MRSIELFTGAGGMAIGMARCGFQHEILIERDPDACETIRLNKRSGVWPAVEWEVFTHDVRDYDYSSIAPGVDLIAGGPPCQPFSLGGKHGGYRDDRDMFPQAVRAVRELRPRAFVFENVKGLLRETFTKYLQYVLLQLEFPDIVREGGESVPLHHGRLQRAKTAGSYDGLRFNLVVDLLNAANYGVPQKRERVFIVGFRSDLGEKWSFPEPTHSREALLRDMWISGEYWDRHCVPRRKRPPRPSKVMEGLQGEFSVLALKGWKTVRDAIHDLPDPVALPGNQVPNHTFNPGARSYPGHTGSPLDEPAKTLKAGDHGVPGGENMLVSPDGSIRYFTVRESARIQTFPDCYLFHGSWTESMRQIGNAVPVTLAEVVGRSVKACLARAGTSAGKRASTLSSNA